MRGGCPVECLGVVIPTGAIPRGVPRFSHVPLGDGSPVTATQMTPGGGVISGQDGGTGGEPAAALGGAGRVDSAGGSASNFAGSGTPPWVPPRVLFPQGPRVSLAGVAPPVPPTGPIATQLCGMVRGVVSEVLSEMIGSENASTPGAQSPSLSPGRDDQSVQGRHSHRDRSSSFRKNPTRSSAKKKSHSAQQSRRVRAATGSETTGRSTDPSSSDPSGDSLSSTSTIDSTTSPSSTGSEGRLHFPAAKRFR